VGGRWWAVWGRAVGGRWAGEWCLGGMRRMGCWAHGRARVYARGGPRVRAWTRAP